MSIDVLQDKIRKMKNPSVLFLEAIPEQIPDRILSASDSVAEATERFVSELIQGLNGIIPAVRFGFGSFALLGTEGLSVLMRSMELARSLGYYVLMDMPDVLTPAAAKNVVNQVGNFTLDGIVISTWLGSDVLKPVSELCRKGTAVFPVVRTSNKSAVELQDLMTGGRLVHTAAADVIARYAETAICKCEYSQMGALAAAGSPQSLQTLRAKFPRLFLLLDGYDYPNANAKNCSLAFDKFGHGAAVCASASLAAAWREEETDGEEFVQQAVRAAERMKKNLTRYVTVL